MKSGLQIVGKAFRAGKHWLGETLHTFGEHEIHIRSAAMAYFVVLSFFPFVLFLIFLGSILLVSVDALDALKTVLENFVPELAEPIGSILDQTVAATGAIGILAGLGLLYSASAAFTVITSTFDTIWEVEHRPFWQGRLIGVLTIIALGLFFVLSIVVSTLPLVAVLTELEIVDEIVDFGFGIGIAVAILWMLYRFVPNAKVSWRASLAGAVLAGLLWESARRIFSWYLTLGLVNLGLIYGSFSSVVVLVIWIYVGALILFIGAEFAATFQRRLLSTS